MEPSLALLPVTIAMIRKSQRASEAHDWVFDGYPYSKVTLVAHLISIDESETKLTYLLDDGTGRITADHWIGSDLAVEEEWKNVQLNTYVRVTGSVRVYQDRKSIYLANIRPSPDPHELYFHLGQVMCANVELHKQSNAPMRSNTVVVNPPASPAELVGLERKIVELVTVEQRDSSGLHVADIVRSLGPEITNADTLEHALQNLIDNGHLYTTSDESTFRSTV